MITSDKCPACGGIKVYPGQTYVGDGIVCHCQYTTFGGTVTISSWIPVPTQLDRIEQMLNELLRIVRNA